MERVRMFFAKPGTAMLFFSVVLGDQRLSHSARHWHWWWALCTRWLPWTATVQPQKGSHVPSDSQLLEMALEVGNKRHLFLTIGLLEQTRALSGMLLRLMHGHEHLAILFHGCTIH